MKYRLEELLDLDQVLALMRSFHELTGVASAIVALDGTLLRSSSGEVVGAGWKRICLDFHRVHPETERHCIESDKGLACTVQKAQPGAYYKCLNGMVDAAIPLVIDGEHVANLFAGQFFFEPPDREFFRRQAERYGFDTDSYLAALDEVPLFDVEYIRRGLDFMTMLAGILGDLGLNQKRLLEQLETSRRAESEAVRLREQAEMAGGVRSRFFAAASHDLRQPVQAVRLFVDVLRERLAGTEHALAIERASEGLTSAETILNALFDVAKIEGGAVAPRPQPVPLAGLFSTLGQEFAPQALAKGVELRWVPSRRSVVSDPLMLERIVRNLVANAVRYTEQGKVLLGCRRRDGMTAIEVWDGGPGIAPVHLKLIWEEFYQVGNEGRDSRQGLGLGLSIARKLAEVLGHRIEVDSVLGRGTVFRVLIAD